MTSRHERRLQPPSFPQQLCQDEVMGKLRTTATIANGASLSTQVPFFGSSLKSLHVPAGAEGEWVAFVRGENGVTGYCRSWSGDKLTAKVSAGDWIEIADGDIASADTLAVELCADESGTPQPQTGSIALTLVGTTR
jgi:hypothetical protein